MGALKLQPWSEQQTGKEIKRRFDFAQSGRKPLEWQWEKNESSVYGPDGLQGFSFSIDELYADLGDDDDADTDNVDINVSYTFKNLRFIHSQLSANPPSVAMKPTSSDQEDRRRASAADRVGRYALRHYKLQERLDRLTLNALVYGLGGIKLRWDVTKGDIIDFDQKTQEMRLEGDIAITIPHTWNLFIDPDARDPDEIKWVIERIFVDYDEACARWPGKADVLEKAKLSAGDVAASSTNQSAVRERHFNSVELLEYWETGLPSNGYMGRFCIALASGETIVPCGPSPQRFAKAGSIAALLAKNLPEKTLQKKLNALPQMAQLPYSFLTDIDVVNSIWGKSSIEYSAPMQDNLRFIDSTKADNMRAHGSAKLVLPQGAKANTDLSNSTWDIVTIEDSNDAPFFMEVPQLMPEMTSARQEMIQGINDVWGTNDAMFGQQQREQSGASMQYATNQGNMIRRRLFNKYVLVVETIYKTILNLVRKHWSVERNILVLGKEKALEAVSLKGADIDGGYDVIGEYGTNLSLDPITRREEIMAMQPMFQAAGISPRQSLKMMKLNDLEGSYDLAQLAEDRMQEVFEEIVATQTQVQPEEFEDHTGMLEFGLTYVMTAEFKYLDDDSKELIREHLRLRKAAAAAEQTGGGTPGGTLPTSPAGAELGAAPAEQVAPVETAPATPPQAAA